MHLWYQVRLPIQFTIIDSFNVVFYIHPVGFTSSINGFSKSISESSSRLSKTHEYSGMGALLSRGESELSNFQAYRFEMGENLFVFCDIGRYMLVCK
jgi:hypothetical protein